MHQSSHNCIVFIGENLVSRSGCVPEMCNETSTTGYVVKSIALERAHFKAEVACDEANGALEQIRVEPSI